MYWLVGHGALCPMAWQSFFASVLLGYGSDFTVKSAVRPRSSVNRRGDIVRLSAALGSTKPCGLHVSHVPEHLSAGIHIILRHAFTGRRTPAALAKPTVRLRDCVRTGLLATAVNLEQRYQ